MVVQTAEFSCELLSLISPAVEQLMIFAFGYEVFNFLTTIPFSSKLLSANTMTS